MDERFKKKLTTYFEDIKMINGDELVHIEDLLFRLKSNFVEIMKKLTLNCEVNKKIRKEWHNNLALYWL